ncbi:SMP-30/gluconolactonase/LRE family protein [Jatrophihabitans sp. DSM 45814]
MMRPAVAPCSPQAGLLSEGPRWDAERAELLWVDILGRHLHRGQVLPNGQLRLVSTLNISRHVGAVAPVSGGGYVLAAGNGFLYVDPDDAVHELAQAAVGHDDVRMNDGACDPQGRFWAGTMAYDESPGAGSLYRLELDGSCTTVLEGLTISNGIGWSPDGRTMYLVDSGPRRIIAFAFDPENGALSGRRTIVQLDEGTATPDGLTVDDEGCLWVAVWDSGSVRRYLPDGSLLATVPMPVGRPTSCAFGGQDRTTLFVTSARNGLSPAALGQQPDAGRVFSVRGLGVTGPACIAYRGQPASI